jgi:hypothetical protein
MTPGNFDWFLHCMLFYHTQNILRKQQIKKKKIEEANETSNNDDDDGGDGFGTETDLDKVD